VDDVRVSTIELFFDLVFVFTITQLTSLLTSEPNAAGLARVVLIFGNVWWMYGGYAWLTNAVPPRQPELRLLLLLGMAGFLVVALAVPDAFGDNGVAFGVGYLVVTLVHTALFLRSTEESTVRAMSRLGPYNAITAFLLLAAGFTDGAGQWTLWTAAFVLHWASPLVTPVGDFPIRAGHFVERHGLIVLIALGESIVAIGIGVQGEELTSGLLVTAVLGLALAAALWWLYFDGEDERAERSLREAPDTRNPWLGLFAFGYAYLAILAGIIVLAAGVKKAVVDYADPATAEVAWFLAGGVAVYMVGLAVFRMVLGTGLVGPRFAIAGVALATVFAGFAISLEAQLAALALTVTAGIVLEPRATRWLQRST
jgi:low temperature requirement protein LtrA